MGNCEQHLQTVPHLVTQDMQHMHTDTCKKKVKVVFYSTVSSPLDRWKRFTLFALPGRPVHSDTNSASPGSILVMQQLRATTKSLTCPPLSIARYSCIQLSQQGRQWRERKCPIFHTVTKQDSNPGSLDCEFGILPLNYRAPHANDSSSARNSSRCPSELHGNIPCVEMHWHVLGRIVRTPNYGTRDMRKTMTENQRMVWVLSMPVCTSINETMQTFSGGSYEASDQNEDKSAARQARYVIQRWTCECRSTVCCFRNRYR